MKLYEATLVEQPDPRMPLVAISPRNGWHEEVRLGGIVILNIGSNLDVPIKYNTPALILQAEGVNVLLGYHNPGDKVKRTPKTIVDGDMFLTSGKTRGIRTSEDGSIELVNMFTKADGEIVIVPLVSYSPENELKVTFEKLVFDMFGANTGGNIAWTQDETLGFNTFISNYKTSNQDLGPRIYHEISGGPAGPKIKYIWDVSPTPVGGVLPAAIDIGLPLSMQVNMDGTSPFSLTLNSGPAPLFQLNIGATGDMEIVSGLAGPSIKLTSTGDVEVKSLGGTGTITMSPIGEVTVKGTKSVKIEGTGGVDMVGLGQSLMDQLSLFIQQYLAHTHPTGTGPSGPPIQAPSTLTGPYANIKAMKGSA